MSATITVLIYDWRFLVAKGIECTLKEHFQNINVYIADNEADFIKLFQRFIPHVVFINETKFEKLLDNKLKDYLRHAKIIIIGKKQVNADFEISFYLPVAASRHYLVKNFNQKILADFDLDEHIENSDLTAREREIVRLIALGYTNQQIAEKLFISPHTVVTHRKNITRKLGIKTISGLTIYAILNNLISLEELEGKDIK
jgi:DNA-binding CsgD family transcriptional regulator